MREIIKFRAWDIHNNKFTYWTMNDLCTYQDKDEKPSALDDWQQYTGLKDEIGNDVYDGDIFEFKCPHCDSVHTAQIVWIDDLAAWGLKDEIQVTPLVMPVDPENIEKGVDVIIIEKVVGNIYQNPELLK